MAKGKAKKDDVDLDAIIAAKEQQQTPVSFFVMAGLLNAIVPVFLFATVLMLDVVSNVIFVVAGIAVAVGCLQMAYQNVAKKLVDKIAQVRREAAHKLVLQERKSSKKKTSGDSLGSDIDSMRVKKESDIALYESRYLALAFINAAFYFVLVISSFYIFQGLHSAYNFGISVSTASLVALFLSTGSK